ncbi:MAG TPA: PAS domain-containing sensor histidine kinase [Candidatus Dormibacteraeota bacterium]|nr:PAS domain-containing sensor histidine kinase [Candidatus Dormibacteraeota bacterium]
MSPKFTKTGKVTSGSRSAAKAGSQQKRSDKKIIDQETQITGLKKLLVYYKEITETTREPFIILDKDLCVVTANPAFYRKFKVRKKDTEGKLIYELGDSQWDAPELRELLENILPTHKVLNNYEVTHDFPKIGTKTILLNARQVDSKQLILLAMEDVTASSMLKIDLDETTANLIMQRDQLQALNEAKDEFISLASHQLRTPATAVKQYVGMLTHDYAGKVSEAQMSMLNIVYESNERQLEIIEDLLRVAKVDSGKIHLQKLPYDIVQQVELVIQAQAVLFKSRHQSVILNKPAKQIIAFVDQKLMLMVLENVLDNAGKYSGGGKQVTIDIEQNDVCTTISIKDNGVGIRKSDRQKLFKKFSRIDNELSTSVRGTGLGLYWAKKILDLHDGSIEVTSVPNKGSTFIVKTPIVADLLPVPA